MDNVIMPYKGDLKLAKVSVMYLSAMDMGVIKEDSKEPPECTVIVDEVKCILCVKFYPGRGDLVYVFDGGEELPIWFDIQYESDSEMCHCTRIFDSSRIERHEIVSEIHGLLESVNKIKILEEEEFRLIKSMNMVDKN